MLKSDAKYPLISAAMQHALREARHFIGATSPNPPVGAAAISENGAILSVAAHQRAGGDHAEAALLKLCRKKNILSQVQAIAVTLEPCNHTGRTPPCAKALIEARIPIVAIGSPDPNPNVKGGGADRLRQAGIEVIDGIEPDACQKLIHAFAYFAKTNHPFVTVKRAFDVNGSMIPPKGKKTFTSPSSLTLAHRLRKKADAILTGSGTILADAPLFNVRHVKDHEGKQRLLAILDRRRRIPQEYLEAASHRGLIPIIYQDLDECFADLSRRSIQDVLVEAGPTLSAAILSSPLWTMRLDIHKAEKDRIETAFNAQTQLPFSPEAVDLQLLLPD